MSRREIGLALQSDKQPGDYGRLAAMAEACRFEVLSVYGDLFYQPPIPALIEAAAATSRIRLGPACLNPYTMHPHEIAGSIAVLDLVSDGRAFLGLAKGSWLDRIGVDQRLPLAHLTEASAVVAMLLGGDHSGFEGEVFRIEPGTALHYRPRRRQVPLLIGGWGPRTLGLAGAIAQEAKVGGTANPHFVTVARERIASGVKGTKRTAQDVALVVGAVTVVDEDSRAARALARREVAMYLDVVAELDPTYPIPDEVLNTVRGHLRHGELDMAGRAIPNEVLDRFAFAGDPQRVADRAMELFEAGADRVEFGTPHGTTPEHGIDLIARNVIPAIEN